MGDIGPCRKKGRIVQIEPNGGKAHAALRSQILQLIPMVQSVDKVCQLVQW